MAPRDEWQGTYERMKHEAKRFDELAKANRRDAIELKKRRRWLEALKCDVRAMEFRRERDNRKAEAKAIKERWGFR